MPQTDREAQARVLAATEYAKSVVIPYRRDDVTYQPSPYERGMMSQLEMAFLAGARYEPKP